MSEKDLKKLTREIVESVARSRGIITYTELANELNDAIEGTDLEPSSDTLKEMLMELSEEDHHDKKGMLSVVVVNKNTKIPGPGFFYLACRLRATGAVPAHASKTQKKKFFNSERQKVYGAQGD